MAKKTRKVAGRPKGSGTTKPKAAQKPVAAKPPQEAPEEKEEPVKTQEIPEETLPPVQEPPEEKPDEPSDTKAEDEGGPNQDAQQPDATDQSKSEVISTMGASMQLAINNLPSDERGKLSDGFHTFDELYEHRVLLFVKLCESIARSGYPHNIWRSKLHNDGTMYEGWFIMGISKHPGRQISYHLPEKVWDDCKFAKTLDRAPEWDGHTSADVLERIKNL